MDKLYTVGPYIVKREDLANGNFQWLYLSSNKKEWYLASVGDQIILEQRYKKENNLPGQ